MGDRDGGDAVGKRPTPTPPTDHNDGPPIDQLIAAHSPEIDALLEDPDGAFADYGFTLVHLGAVVGDSAYLVELLEHHNALGMIQLQDSYGRTPVAYTAILGAVDACVTLLGAEGGVEAANTHDHQGRTAGHLAATYGHADLLEVLLERGVNVGAVDSNGQTLMHNSVHSTACLNIALRMADAAIINQADSEGFTAMHYAVSGKELEAIKAIVGASGVNVGQTDADGRTALHWACAVGDADIARVLIANGASIASVDVGNTTPLEYAVLEDHVDCVTVVTTGDGASVAAHQDGEGRTPLIQAAGVGATASITTLLQLPNLADFLPLQGFDGRSALHVAAFNQIVDSTVEIWTAGGDLDAQDGAGETPVMIAASGGGGVLLALHSAGAVPDVRVVDLTGMTALHHAATAGNADEVGVLLGWDSGQLPMVDERGETALHYACFYGHYSVAEAIIAVGQESPSKDYDLPSLMNIQDKEGVTAMHWAARQGHTDIVTLLINNGAYPNYPDHSEYRQTPMDMCIDGQHNDTYEVLMAVGAVDAFTLFTHAAVIVQAVARGWLARMRLAKGVDPTVSTVDPNAVVDHRVALSSARGTRGGGGAEQVYDYDNADAFDEDAVTDDDLDFQYNGDMPGEPVDGHTGNTGGESYTEQAVNKETSPEAYVEDSHADSDPEDGLSNEDTQSELQIPEDSESIKSLAHDLNQITPTSEPNQSNAPVVVKAQDPPLLQTVPLADVQLEQEEDRANSAAKTEPNPSKEEDVEEELARVQVDREALELRLRIREVEERADEYAANKREADRRTEANRTAVHRAQERVKERRRFEVEEKKRRATLHESPRSPSNSNAESGTSPASKSMPRAGSESGDNVEEDFHTPQSPVMAEYLSRHTRQFDEQQRLMQLRYKMDAAIVIQRAYRRYSQGSPEGGGYGASLLSPQSTMSPMRSRHTRKSYVQGSLPPLRTTPTQRSRNHRTDSTRRLTRYGADGIDGTTKPLKSLPSRPRTSAAVLTPNKKTIYRRLSTGAIKLQPLPGSSINATNFRQPVRMRTQRFVSPPTHSKPLRSASGLSLLDFRKWETSKGLSKTGTLSAVVNANSPGRLPASWFDGDEPPLH